MAMTAEKLDNLETIMAVTIDQEFKTLIPAISQDEYSQLERSILAEGCRDALVTWGDILIDGHNRYKICTRNDIPFTVVDRQFESRDEAKEWIICNQFGRRNLSLYDRSLLGLRLEEVRKPAIVAMAKENLKTSTGGVAPRPLPILAKAAIDTREEIAKIAGVSHGTMDKVKIIEQKAPEETKIKLHRGDLSINEAYKEIKAEEKSIILEGKKQEILALSRQEIEDNSPIVYHEDYLAFLNRFAECDLLLTDPPYSTDIEDITSFVDAWLYKALSKVKTTGRAYIFIGAYPREVQAYLNAKIPDSIVLEQILVWAYKNTLGAKPKDRYILNYQNCLYFKGVDAPDLDCPITDEQWAVQEVNAPDGRAGDRYHSWQKPLELAERFVRHGSKIGDVVLDPFVCTGVYLVYFFSGGFIGIVTGIVP